MSDPLHIGVTVPAPDQEWTSASLWYAKKAVSEISLKNPSLKIVLRTADYVEDQVGQIEDFIHQGIDCLVILPVESAGPTPIVKEAMRRGIFVVDTDRGLLDEAHDIYLTGDNYSYGKMAGEWMAAQMKGKGRLVAITGVPCTIDTTRMAGFHDALSRYPSIRILDEQVGYWNKEKSVAILENFLSKYPHIDGVYSQDDGVQEAVLQAYKRSQRADASVFFGGTGQRATLQRILNDDPFIRATVTYTPSLIYTSIYYGVAAMLDRGFEFFQPNQIPSRVIVKSELITRDNALRHYEPNSVF